MAQANSGNKRTFGVGGTVTIDTHTINNIVKGTLEFDVPGAEEMPQETLGTIGDSLAGGDRPSTGKLTLHLAHLLDGGGGVGTIGGLTLAGVVASGKYLNWDTANGEMKQHTIVVKIPSHKGSSTGESITFSKAILPDGIKYRSGQSSGENFDTLELSFKDLADSPAFATY